MAVTTEQLIALAQEAADLTNVVDYVTPATWTSWLNAGVLELHRFVTNKFKATYFRTSDFTLAGATYQQTLPAAFWRLKALDIDADTPRRRAVVPFNFAERNRYRQDYMRDFGPAIFCPDRYYSVVGSSLLQVQPQERAAGNYRLYYTPKPTTLVALGTLDAELEPFSEYVWLTAAIKSLIKEESFAQAKMLADQRNLIREDLTEALETDQGGPSTIIDTDDWDD